MFNPQPKAGKKPIKKAKAISKANVAVPTELNGTKAERLSVATIFKKRWVKPILKRYVNVSLTGEDVPGPVGPVSLTGFDRKTYQRDLMRKRRASCSPKL